MKKIKIAQIGTSKYSHGSSIFMSLVKQSDVFEIVGYALPENEREKFPEEVKCFDGYREMTVDEILNDPEIEAVTVETEEIYLTKYALMVARAGKHLHMEKPGSPSLGDFRTLIGILKEKGLAFTTGYMYRFNPKVKEALARIKRGELGKIFAVEAQMNCKHDKALREWLAAFPHGMTFFLGCHLIDLVYGIQGEPEEVIPLSCKTEIDGVDTFDYGMAVFKYKNGVSFIKTCDEEVGGFVRRHLLITGEKGSIEIKPLEYYPSLPQSAIQTATARECFDTSVWQAEWTESTSEPYDRYDDMMKNFAEIVRGKENPYSYDYELKLFELILKCCREEIPV